MVEGPIEERELVMGEGEIEELGENDKTKRSCKEKVENKGYK